MEFRFFVLVFLLFVLLKEASSNHCNAAIFKGPFELLEETTGSTAIFKCTAFGASDPRKRSHPCRSLFDEGDFNPVRVFWHIKVPSLNLQLFRRRSHMLVSTSDLPMQLQNQGVRISNNCSSEVSFRDYRLRASGRLATEPPDFCLSELSCVGTLSIPVERLTNNTVVQCGVYSTECENNISNLDNDEVFMSNEGKLLVRESLLEVQVSTSPGELCVNCLFTPESTALGCHVKILLSANAINSASSFNVTTERPIPTCLTGLSNGTYVVTAVEIDRTGTIGTQEIEKIVNVEKDSESEAETINLSAIAGTVLSGGIGLILLVTFVVCTILLRRKHTVAKLSLKALPSGHTRDYPNHSDKQKPIDHDMVTNTPTTPMPAYVNIGTENDDILYDYAFYATKMNRQQFLYMNSNNTSTNQQSDASNHNGHLNINVSRNQCPAYEDQHADEHLPDDPGYMHIRTMSNDDGIVTKICAAYEIDNNQD